MDWLVPARHTGVSPAAHRFATDNPSPRAHSQLCGKLAAEGNVVIAIEHRDGTAPATIHPIDGKAEAHHYIKVEELDWEDKTTNPTTPMPLRTQQLEIRHVEILEAFKAFKRIVEGDKSVLCNAEEYPVWDSWVNQVDTETVVFDGHSFGGCTGVGHFIQHYLFAPLTLCHSDPPLNVTDPRRIRATPHHKSHLT
jgi:hypothetical protein